MAAVPNQQYLQALVDMGSNGIRFSISDLSPPTARVLPTIYQDRCGVSLYDAQYSTGKKAAIPDNIIKEVLAALLRFKTTCRDFGVADQNVRIVATEATREAINSVEYRQLLETRTGWRVEMLAKEEEGRIGAMGVASSFSSLKGLVMDLGGGSVQLTWMIAMEGEVQTSPQGSVSLPYGAAALTRLLAEAETSGSRAASQLQQEMTAKFKQAIKDLQIPSAITHATKNEDGLTLYLSGGGFRGWGYILMVSHEIQPYPIPLINGFQVFKSSFLPKAVAESSINNSTFGISSRRASQVPAVSFLITALTNALPSLTTIRFAQGGLREGLLFSSLPVSIRRKHPLITATIPHAPPSTDALLQLLKSGIPSPRHDLKIPKPAFLTDPALLIALVHLLNTHSPLPKDIRAVAAVRSTTSGVVASAHGLAHEDRALLALALCERWDGEVSPSDTVFHSKLQELVGKEQSWWARYVGRVAQAVGECYPAGIVRDGEERIGFNAGWGVDKKGERCVEVQVRLRRDDEVIPSFVGDLEKVGKKKNWIGGRDGWGIKVEVEVVRDLGKT